MNNEEQKEAALFASQYLRELCNEQIRLTLMVDKFLNNGTVPIHLRPVSISAEPVNFLKERFINISENVNNARNALDEYLSVGDISARTSEEE